MAITFFPAYFDVSNQLISLASRETFNKEYEAVKPSTVSNQLISLASREIERVLDCICEAQISFQSINFPSE